MKRTAARGVAAVLDGRNARSAEAMRSEFGEAVSRQGAPRDELIQGIMGYGERKPASAGLAVPQEELVRAILSGGGLAMAGGSK